MTRFTVGTTPVQIDPGTASSLLIVNNSTTGTVLVGPGGHPLRPGRSAAVLRDSGVATFAVTESDTVTIDVTVTGTYPGATVVPAANPSYPSENLIGTAAQWTAHDLVLDRGQEGIQTGTPGTELVKIGDGATRFSQLPSAGGGGAAYLTQSAATGTYVRRFGTPSTVVKVDVTQMRAPNAAAGMAIPTYDGGNQLTHSSVVYDQNGWNGWKYWMAATPYAGANSQVENPSIYVANDPSMVGGANGWQVPAGLTNPIEPTPGSGTSYNSDCDLEWGPDGTLYCFWRAFRNDLVGTNREQTIVKSSTGGITWSNRTVLLSNDDTLHRLAAPSVVYDGTLWNMWVVDIVPSPNLMQKWTATSPFGPWTKVSDCTITGMPGLGSTREVWHIDVNRWGADYHMLINDSVLDQAGSNGLLYVASSTDGGITWTCSPNPLINRRAWAFDTSFYRSSMVPKFQGDQWGYEIIYAGISGLSGTYLLGRTFAPFNGHVASAGTAAVKTVPHGLADPNVANILASRLPLHPFVAGDAFQRIDATSLGTAESGQTWTVQAGVPGIASHFAYATTAVNTKAVIDAGISDGYFEIGVEAFGSSAWFMFRNADTNNYWRLGFASSSSLQIQKVVAGAATALNGAAMGAAWTAGTRLGVLCSGNNISVFRDGVLLDTWTDSFGATNTKVGYQTADITTRFGPIYARSLVGGS